MEVRLERLVVLGAGAIGGSVGGLVAESGLPVVLVARGAHGAALRDDGLALLLPDRTLALRVPCVERLDQVDWRAGDVALLATKLQDAEAALDDLRAAAGPDVPVACAVNGVHGERWAAARFACVLSTLVWVAAEHLVPGEVRLYSAGVHGVLDTGPVQGDPDGAWSRALCARFRVAAFDALARDDIARWKAAKWLTNLGGAAQALVTDDWQRVAAAARAEGERVLERAGVARVPEDAFLARVGHVAVQDVGGAARGGGSTWQSRQLGKPLESPWLEGALAELARTCGEPAPVNTFLAAAARAPRALTAAEVLAAIGERRADPSERADR